MDEKIEGDALVANLKQLILHFGPIIKASGSGVQAEESLVNLEANDPHFHRYVITHIFHSSNFWCQILESICTVNLVNCKIINLLYIHVIQT